jgi:serralysin
MRLLLAIVLPWLLAAAPADAAFHLWKVNEVFSSADESVQFVELFDASDFEHQITGHEVRVRAGSTTLDEFLFLEPLGTTDTGGKTLLLATPGFAAVSGVSPDYEIDTGFIDLAQATSVAWDDLDVLSIAGLPIDGRSSLNRNPGGDPLLALATPRNFAGQQGAIDLPEPDACWLGLVAAAILAGLAAWQERRARSR